MDYSSEINRMQIRLKNAQALSLDNLKGKETALFVVDMIGGFTKKGALYSERSERLIPKICSFVSACRQKEIECIAFADSHPADSPEFDGYPAHCLAGTEESELVEGLFVDKLIPKNSTNGLFAPGFGQWLTENEDKQNFLITGVCTDICIYQFATALKCWFNQKNLRRNVIVPFSMVDTFDMEGHNAQLSNLVFLNSLIDNGIKVVKDIC